MPLRNYDKKEGGLDRGGEKTENGLKSSRKSKTDLNGLLMNSQFNHMSSRALYQERTH